MREKLLKAILRYETRRLEKKKASLEKELEAVNKELLEVSKM